MISNLICNILASILSLFSFNNDKDMKTFEKDTYRLKSGKYIEITFYGHASLCIDYNGKTIYVDPVSEYADFSKERKADILLVTHEHYDHFDKKAIHDLTKENTTFIANPNTINLYGEGVAIRNYETTDISGISIKAFPAYNTTEGRDKFHPQGRDNGYLITIEEFRIYVSGDTEIIHNEAEIRNCDILFLAVNQPYTMTIDQASYFANQIQPKFLYPYHTTDTDITRLYEVMKQYSFKTIIHSMK
ncbi:MAG: MBL fold metallo-hydrolase [Bacteroidales bacterium]|nr:MBL fold metallo-hydrolase [Bacteroidales bacterium]